jgi:hypothetical protein
LFDWVVDSLYGADDLDTSNSWVSRFYNSDEAPILRLCEAILQQAASDQASGIRFLLGQERPTVHAPPTHEDYQRELERLERIRLGKDRFAQVMAEAGVKEGRPAPPGPNRLLVDYKFSGQYRQCMSIPLNLADPTVRAMKYKFNFEKCSSLEKPAGLLYRRGFFFTMQQWSLDFVFIGIEPDPDPFE